MSRSLFAGLSCVIGATAYGFAIEPKWFKSTTYTIKSKKWPYANAPLTLAIGADFHVGCPSVTLQTLRKVVHDLNAMQADCILLLGDFLTKGTFFGKRIAPEPIAEILSDLSAPLGVHAVLGNHDWWVDGEGIWKALETAGIKVLENDAYLVKCDTPFWMTGLADDTMRIVDIEKTLQKISTDDPVIMLSHDPAPFMDMSDRPVVTLAGHTHGGQVAAPFWGPMIVPGRAPLRYAYGHITEDNRDMIVTSGLGTSILPLRFNQRPELVHLTIETANS